MKIRKLFKRFGIVLGSILVIGLIVIGLLLKNDIATLSSVKQINDNNKAYPFYTMTYSGNYHFEEYLKVGSETDQEYADFVLKKTTYGLDNPLNKKVPNCSSFTAIAPNGDRLFARNLDTTSAMPLLLTTNSSAGFKSISMVNLENFGFQKTQPIKALSRNGMYMLASPYVPLEGMNEYGLAICVLTAVPSKDNLEVDKVTINDFSIIRMVLDKVSTVEEAVAMIENYNMSFFTQEFPSHFMIADASGASVVVEYIQGELQLVYSDEPYHAVTNFILYNNQTGGYGRDRYDRIKAKLGETDGILSEKEALQLLSENTIKGDEQWSAVYNLTQKKAYICVGQDYETIYEFGIE